MWESLTFDYTYSIYTFKNCLMREKITVVKLIENISKNSCFSSPGDENI